MSTLYSDSLARKLSNWILDLILTTFFHSFHILTFKLRRIISVFLLGVLLPLLRKSTFLPQMAFSSVLTFYSWCEHRVWSKKVGFNLDLPGMEHWTICSCIYFLIYRTRIRIPVRDLKNSHVNWYQATAAAAAKSLQSSMTLCDPIDGSPLGSPVPGILQARTLEWVAISFSNAWKWKVKVKSLSRVRLLVTPWTAAHQAPPSMGFSRQEYWSGVPLPSLLYQARSSH